MKTFKLKPFNLEKALAGEPVMTRDLSFVKIYRVRTISGRKPRIYGHIDYSDGKPANRNNVIYLTWDLDGTDFRYEESPFDLFMVKP